MKGLKLFPLGMRPRVRGKKVVVRRKASGGETGFPIFGATTRRLRKRVWGWAEPRNMGRK